MSPGRPEVHPVGGEPSVPMPPEEFIHRVSILKRWLWPSIQFSTQTGGERSLLPESRPRIAVYWWWSTLIQTFLVFNSAVLFKPLDGTLESLLEWYLGLPPKPLFGFRHVQTPSGLSVWLRRVPSDFAFKICDFRY